MLNTSVISFYDNFGGLFKGAEDMASIRALKIGRFRPHHC